jgi:hypothetical protein
VAGLEFPRQTHEFDRIVVFALTRLGSAGQEIIQFLQNWRRWRESLVVRPTARRAGNSGSQRRIVVVQFRQQIVDKTIRVLAGVPIPRADARATAAGSEALEFEGENTSNTPSELRHLAATYPVGDTSDTTKETRSFFARFVTRRE